MDILENYIVANELRMAYVATENGDLQVNPGIDGIGDKQRKLIIHFDIRNTVLVADSVTNASMEQALNSFLTGVVWGREHSKGQWVWASKKPSLTAPCENTITYYKHMERILVKTPTDRAKLRAVTGDFTQENIGKSFSDCFTCALEALEWKHKVTKEHEGMTMAGKDGKPYHYLLKSVYKLIYHLVETNRDFAIVFRTYGLDAPNVIASLSKGLQGDHPCFPKNIGLKTNYTPGLVFRKNDDSVVFETVEIGEGCGSPERSEVTEERDIYNMLSAKEGISAYKDDFIFWQSNEYSHESAKPLYIDPFDDSVHHIFFDDNIRTSEDDSIVNVRLFESKGCTKARSLTKSEAAKFEDNCLVQADLLMAVEDDDYYVKCVSKCESNYTKFVNRYRASGGSRQQPGEVSELSRPEGFQTQISEKL